ncbi:MAG: hypothetical protein GY820_06540 [Gammaproteobacteria bacterium]|nr:hypothetical protein [Gammaproteobacteria bacterium]
MMRSNETIVKQRVKIDGFNQLLARVLKLCERQMAFLHRESAQPNFSTHKTAVDILEPCFSDYENESSAYHSKVENEIDGQKMTCKELGQMASQTAKRNNLVYSKSVANFARGKITHGDCDRRVLRKLLNGYNGEPTFGNVLQFLLSHNCARIDSCTAERAVKMVSLLMEEKGTEQITTWNKSCQAQWVHFVILHTANQSLVVTSCAQLWTYWLGYREKSLLCCDRCNRDSQRHTYWLAYPKGIAGRCRHCGMQEAYRVSEIAEQSYHELLLNFNELVPLYALTPEQGRAGMHPG